MTRDLEILLARSFRNIIKVYINAFPRSFATFRRAPVDFSKSATTYAQFISTRCDPLYRIAAREIGEYLSSYSVHAHKSPDEYKIIYFMGRAIERLLRKEDLVELAQIHLFTMIGLLDKRLQTLEIAKPQLTRAMTKLITDDRFERELGRTGCYLIYKSLGATVRGAIE